MTVRIDRLARKLVLGLLKGWRLDFISDRLIFMVVCSNLSQVVMNYDSWWWWHCFAENSIGFEQLASPFTPDKPRSPTKRSLRPDPPVITSMPSTSIPPQPLTTIPPRRQEPQISQPQPVAKRQEPKISQPPPIAKQQEPMVSHPTLGDTWQDSRMSQPTPKAASKPKSTPVLPAIQSEPVRQALPEQPKVSFPSTRQPSPDLPRLINPEPIRQRQPEPPKMPPAVPATLAPGASFGAENSVDYTNRGPAQMVTFDLPEPAKAQNGVPQRSATASTVVAHNELVSTSGRQSMNEDDDDDEESLVLLHELRAVAALEVRPFAWPCSYVLSRHSVKATVIQDLDLVIWIVLLGISAWC